MSVTYHNELVFFEVGLGCQARVSVSATYPMKLEHFMRLAELVGALRVAVEGISKVAQASKAGLPPLDPNQPSPFG